jgi:hypothetical protein
LDFVVAETQLPQSDQPVNETVRIPLCQALHVRMMRI